MKTAAFLSIILFFGFVLAEDLTKHANVRQLEAEELLFADNGKVKIGVDAAMGASITFLDWEGYRRNVVNIHDPGRLIQQSYYAGKSLDRIADGQSKSWSPWPWNPIQGGGVGSWARVTTFEKTEGGSLYSETIPKLWDMYDEEAAAVMRQETGFEAGFPNVVVVKCELESRREEDDIWGPKGLRHQEIPALYFTRNFSLFRVYEGEGKWSEAPDEPGLPWSRIEAPHKVMACFNLEGQGIAVFSPGATELWNYGAHGSGNSDEATDGPCVHLAPIVKVNLLPKTTIRYRYWLVVGTEEEIVPVLDALIQKYRGEKVEMVNP